MFDLIIRGGTVVDGTGGPAFTADVGVRDGLIAEVGMLDGPARRSIDADGALVAPGWIDPHTHYDGQVTWDDRLEGSASNGVTTVVMGNCGVGFAPVSPTGHDDLIDLMEGVEDIPGTALVEGIPWGQWETFPDYLAFLDTRSWAIDVGVQVPHGPLRVFAMGSRAVDHDLATSEDTAAMAAMVEEAVRAGALGFSTSRTIGHRAMSGYSVPGTFADYDELLALALAVRAGGGTALQAVPAGGVRELPGQQSAEGAIIDEIALFGKLSRATGLSLTFSMLQVKESPILWRDMLAASAMENHRGAHLHPMVAPRAVTLLTSLQSHHLFQRRPTYLQLQARLPFEELVREMANPEVRSTILSEHDRPDPRPGSMENVLPVLLRQGLWSTFPLREPIDYEPLPGDAIVARSRVDRSNPDALMYDFLLGSDGTAIGIYLASNYVDGDLEACRGMLRDPNTIPGLSDAGAHVTFVCDMSTPTFNLTHWVRDRTRGSRLPLEYIVERTTSRPAALFGLTDRGTIHPGKRADLNVIDLEHLKINLPTLRYDLPAGGARLLQSSSGYIATMVRGEITRCEDVDTGARPGRVARRSV